MINKLLLILCMFFLYFVIGANEITPHKYTDSERQNGHQKYDIPPSSRFSTKRIDDSDIVYYFSQPKKQNFPIAILSGGSSLENDIASIIHFHRYFLQEFLDLGLVVAGTKDSIIDSADAFVKKAKKAGAPVTYMRISDMDHYVRKKEDIIKDSFTWLKEKLY